ncbi:hypothetical protein ABRP70_19000 [Pectobacterium odoriferum]|uniref:Lipoprotein n=1 Tax=Pectobacterium odoriferum TaxID=78398 RepID=A0ABD6VTB9_9GAMM|nr:hypothetical protein [Pectobacterium odoriferum]AIU88374.1 hypothetical protein BCS7_09670 [Pectobacterium odoriferum]KGA38670.1 hypothetical protein KS43_03645 [Pectobacterium odoriferum]KGA39975.1 hypothetical protein KU75_19430 [Pectobacterium odoriferum]MBA0189009.1 hypothetical protein [Pectobacterium odoriferum]POD94895.1 hypothetical protein BV925_01935 [Pectobacterium odoriferum]
MGVSSHFADIVRANINFFPNEAEGPLLALVIVVLLSGCGISKPSSQQIATFKNDELCKALGTYNYDGQTILRLTAELKRRGSSINQEQCYALSRTNMNPRDYLIGGEGMNNNLGDLRQERNEREIIQEKQRQQQLELERQSKIIESVKK